MEQQILATGTILGDRFEVVTPVGESGFGHMYLARDKERGTQAALRVLPKALVDDAALELLRERMRVSATLQHRNIQAQYGMGRHTDGSVFVAGEWVAGQNLRVLLNSRGEAGKRFSFKGAYNVLGHVCNALSYGHATMCHGALAPRAILINDAGRVKVSDFGLALLRVGSQTYTTKNVFEPLFWAPEVLKGDANAITAAADIYSLGGMFYELITGVPPKRPLKPPSVMGFSKDVDDFIASCMAADPRQRFRDATAAKMALAKIVKAHKSEDERTKAEDDDLAIDVEIDLSSRPAPPQPMVSRAAHAPAPGPVAATRPAPPAVSLPSPPPMDFSSGKPTTERASFIDMGAVLSNLGKSETAHWMVQKGKFDHGPFTDRELVQMISMGEVLGQHNLLDMSSGVRKTVRTWNHFEPFLEEFRIRKQKQDEALALEKTQKAETRGTAFKLVIALGIVGLIVVVVGGFLLSRKLREDSNRAPEDPLAALQAGEIKLKTGSLDDARDPQAKKRRGGKRGGGGGGDFVPGMSYEEAMAKGVNLGDLKTASAGGIVLSAADINRVMDRNVRSFLPCVAGGSVKRVDVEIAIDGSGRVIGASVRQGDSGLKRCVEGKVRSIHFPESSQPRTATSWYFELY